MDLTTSNGYKVKGCDRVYDWYVDKYPHDDWAKENLNKGILFQDVYECLQVGFNIYALLGAGDSIVRERVFEALATLMDCGYEHIYYQWLNHSKDPLEGKKIEDMRGMRFKND